MKMDSHHFFHAVLDHLGGEEVGLAFLVHSDLPVVLQEDGANGFCRVGHVDGPIVANHLAEIGQGSAVVQMEVAGERARPKHNQSGGQTCQQVFITKS